MTLKTKYAKKGAEAFKKMIKIKRSKGVCFNKATEFLGALKTLCKQHEIRFYSTFSEKNLHSRKRDTPFEKYSLQIFRREVVLLIYG